MYKKLNKYKNVLKKCLRCKAPPSFYLIASMSITRFKNIYGDWKSSK